MGKSALLSHMKGKKHAVAYSKFLNNKRAGAPITEYFFGDQKSSISSSTDTASSSTEASSADCTSDSNLVSQHTTTFILYEIIC